MFPIAWRAYRIRDRVMRFETIRTQTGLFTAFSHHSCFSGYRSMNTKLVLSALVAALMLSACQKQEAAAPAAEPPAAEAPAADAAAPAAEATPPAEGAAAPPADAAAAPPADAAAAPAPAEPPKQ
jgi:hypothetical protein